MNDMFQEYKKSFEVKYVSLAVKDKGLQIEELQETEEIELPEEIQRGYIELEDMTEEELKDYQEHKRKRNERAYQRLGYDLEMERDKKWQREIFEINLEETRGR